MIEGLAPHADLDRGRAERDGWYGGVQCPFHGADRNGSASWNPGKQRFRCHACGIAGDGLDVIQAVVGGDLASARARALEICGASGFHSSSSMSAGDGMGGKGKLDGRKSAERRRLVRDRYGSGKGRRKL